MTKSTGLGAAALAAALAVLGAGPALRATPGPRPAGQEPAGTRRTFAEFLEGIRREAIGLGLRPAIVEAALADVEEPLAVVIERDRSQAETVLTLEQYLERQVTRSRVTRGRAALDTHRRLLDRVAARYGVPPQVIVAVWGIESNYGRFSGVRPTVTSLATLAWDPRRSGLFRRELFSALEILDRGDIELAAMRGSWAGAMGQPQFMPSSYLRFAEDFDGDGRRDIWSSPADVFASIANYLKGNGWNAGERWGREVRVPRAAAERIAAGVARREDGCRAKQDMTVVLPMRRWNELGVRFTDGRPLPSRGPDAALVAGTGRRYFLAYRNYDALLEYNCAHAYAISVGLIADQVARP